MEAGRKENLKQGSKVLLKAMPGSRKRSLKAEKGTASERAPKVVVEGSKWSDADTILLLETLLGSKSTVFNLLTSNPKTVYQMVSLMY